MKSTRHRKPRYPVLLLCVAVALGVPWVGWAVTTSGGLTGKGLLRAQIPEGYALREMPCERLARAVRMATLSHHRNAAAILSAALAAEDKRSCECVVRLFRSAMYAAPDHANELLETAAAAYPECNDALAAALGQMSDKNVVADPKDSPVSALASRDAGDPVLDPPLPDLSARDYQGLGLNTRDPGLSSVFSDPTSIGFGAGFPGSPGFSGSTASSAFALPPPVSPAVTSTVNR